MLIWTFITAGMLLVAVGGIGSRLSFERLVDAQHQTRRNEWTESGKPVGGIATRKDISFWSSGFATQRAFNEWLLSAPPWISATPELRRTLRSMRLFAGLTLPGIALMFVGGFLALH